jgi:hypothetical protein
MKDKLYYHRKYERSADRTGLIEVKYTTRECLSCQKLFKSWGIANRVCRNCKLLEVFDGINDEGYHFNKLYR